jgi:hypothetical protein
MRPSLIACALLLSSLAVSPAAHAGATRYATGSYRFYNVVIETTDGRWRQTVSNSFSFVTDYVSTEGHHGSSIDSTARIGAKNRAVSAAMKCLGSFYLSGAGSDSWKKNCSATAVGSASILAILDASVNFQQLARTRFCATASSLATAAGQTGSLMFSANVRAFGDSEGTEADTASELGTIRGYCN